MPNYDPQLHIGLKEAKRHLPVGYDIYDVSGPNCYGYDFAIFPVARHIDLRGETVLHNWVMRELDTPPVLSSFSAYDADGTNRIGGRGCTRVVFERAAFEALAPRYLPTITTIWGEMDEETFDSPMLVRVTK